MTGTDGGVLVLSGQVSGLYMVDGTASSDPDTVTNYGTLGMYAGVVIAQGKTLTVQLAGAPGDTDGDGAVINNLLGATGSTLKVENTNADGGNAVVILNNERLETGLPAPDDYAGADSIMGGKHRWGKRGHLHQAEHGQAHGQRLSCDGHPPHGRRHAHPER